MTNYIISAGYVVFTLHTILFKTANSDFSHLRQLAANDDGNMICQIKHTFNTMVHLQTTRGSIAPSINHSGNYVTKGFQSMPVVSQIRYPYSTSSMETLEKLNYRRKPSSAVRKLLCFRKTLGRVPAVAFQICI